MLMTETGDYIHDNWLCIDGASYMRGWNRKLDNCNIHMRIKINHKAETYIYLKCTGIQFETVFIIGGLVPHKDEWKKLNVNIIVFVVYIIIHTFRINVRINIKFSSRKNKKKREKNPLFLLLREKIKKKEKKTLCFCCFLGWRIFFASMKK